MRSMFTRKKHFFVLAMWTNLFRVKISIKLIVRQIGVEFPIRREYEIELKDFQKSIVQALAKSTICPIRDRQSFLIDFAIEMEDREPAIFKLKPCHSCGRGETSN